ncbi:MAG TPA: tRNA1(Val) (adenine(37)-N6)-methyltransferase [Halanaerobiales bacterium]|mgnify:CR=1 FL=1|nr:tRNA1(Val) (adenine(37)-N6)-methyltransferase [Halanaerobiales bacterium]
MEERNELIKNEMDIIQNNKFFKFGTDSVLLANFVESKSSDIIVDFGSGSGVIPLLLAFKKECKKIVGIEIQKKLVNLARKNIKLNNYEDKIKIIEGDFSNSREYIEPNIFDIVISNPPYLKTDTGKISENKYKAIARHEIKANLEDVIRETALALKNGGKFYLVYRSNRMEEVFHLLNKYKLSPKRLKPIYPRKNYSSNHFLLEASLNGGIGLELESSIIIYKENSNEYTKQVKRVYGIDE